MTHVVMTPDFVASAAADLAAMGSAVDAAGAAAAKSTTSLLAAAADEVSTSVAEFFGALGVQYQAASAQVAQFQQGFVRTLTSSANAYLATEITNAEHVLVGTGAATAAGAEIRITVPGAGPLYLPEFLTRLPFVGRIYLLSGVPGPDSVSMLQGYSLLNAAIGQNWFPGGIARVINYPASMGLLSGSPFAPTVNDAVLIGQQMLHGEIMNAVATAGGSPVNIAALSQGTLVVNRELAYLATDPTAPPPHALRFAMFGSPELGLAQTYLPNGFTLPLVDYTVQGLPNTQYDVSVVFGQYDFWSNPPDRPWNLPAWVNSLFGLIYQHDPAALASMSDAVTVSSVNTAAGGTITTYMIPAPTLPMLLPLAQLGVPQPIVHCLNSLLQPIVDAGYSSLTPNAGPYFSHGSLVGLPNVAGMVRDLLS